ncbi:MAG: hypothetical protein WC294_04920 [Methanoregula sp.]|jgi:hypothetical protein
MIDYTSFRAAIEKYIHDNFTIVSVVYENTAPPEGERIMISEVDSSSEPFEMGSDVRLVNGNIIIDIDTKYGIGTNKAKQIASRLAAILVTDNVLGVSFGEPEFSSVGKLEGADLYRHNFVIPYQYLYGVNITNAC